MWKAGHATAWQAPGKTAAASEEVNGAEQNYIEIKEKLDLRVKQNNAYNSWLWLVVGIAHKKRNPKERMKSGSYQIGDRG